jgi:hypothetical protein
MKPCGYFSASSIASSGLLYYIIISFSEFCFFVCHRGLVVFVVVAAAAALVTLPAPPPHGLAIATVAAKISIICIV